MKTYFRIKVLTTNLLLLVFSFTFAQDDQPPWLNPAYGPDSLSRIQCANDLSTISEFVKIDLYEYALPPWRKVYTNYPAASKNIYISGVRMYSKMIEETRDQKLRMAYFDTLMDIYDRRIEYFGEEGYVSGRKGIDIIRYNEKAYNEAYHSFLRSVELTGKEADLNVIAGFIQTGSFMLKFSKIDQEAYLDNYLTSYNILNQKLSVGEDANKISKVKNMINKVLTTSSIRDCEVIEGTFNKEFDNNGTDPAILKTAEQLLSTSGCNNTAFYAEINEKLMEVSPDPGLAYEVARFNIKNENFEKAADYLGKAIQHENDSGQKAIYQYQLAVILSSRLQNYTEAKKMALQATINKKGYGEPYLLIASNYITGFKECNPDPFELAAIYWLAVDYCNKAKQTDPTLESRVNELITQYKQYYPSVEDTFFRSLKAGDNYSFGCWINETTTVKEK